MENSSITGTDYRYIDQMVANIRHSLQITRDPLPIKRGVLVSIQIQSNRPENFTAFLDSIEATIAHPGNVEVVVKIDDTDIVMNELLPREVAKRPFAVKYISTPLVGGFFELWRSMNDMLEVCDPHAYFLWNLNDEVTILNKGWDIALEKYVGLFPDHIFRLRTSMFKARNYCDFWENGFAPDTSVLNTKRWIDIGGDWNPCLGPDSFQQCVAYYFAWHDRFNKFKPMREIPIYDLKFGGEGAYLGLEGEKLWKRMRGGTKAWYRLMSHAVQQDASRRAQKLHAHICAFENRLDDFTVEDNTRKGRLLLWDNESDRVIRTFPYKLSHIRIGLSNMLRSPYYLYYAGGGIRAKWILPISLLKFLSLRYDAFEWLYPAALAYSENKSRFMKAMIGNGGAIHRSLRDSLSSIHHVLRKYSSAVPLPVRRATRVALLALHPVFRMVGVVRYYMVELAAFLLNMGYPFAVLASPLTSIFLQIDKIHKRKIYKAMPHVVFPERYIGRHYRHAVLKSCMLVYWYKLPARDLLAIAEERLDLRRFIGVRRYAKLPTVSDVNVFIDTLKENKVWDKVMTVIEKEVDLSFLPPLDQPEKSLSRAA